MADELGEQGSDDRAGARDAGLERRPQRVDALHDLDLALGRDLARVAAPVGPPCDEEGRVPGIAKGRLHDEIRAKTGARRQPPQLLEARHAAQYVGHARHAGLVADPHRLDFIVEPRPQRRRRQPDLHAELVAERFGVFVEHEEHGHRIATAGTDEADHIAVTKQVVVDVLDAAELRVVGRGRDVDVGVTTVVGVDVTDVAKPRDPLVHAGEIEVGGSEEVDGAAILAKVAAHVRHAAERFAAERKRCRATVAAGRRPLLG